MTDGTVEINSVIRLTVHNYPEDVTTWANMLSAEIKKEGSLLVPTPKNEWRSIVEFLIAHSATITAVEVSVTDPTPTTPENIL